jgi:hypothetical protein
MKLDKTRKVITIDQRIKIKKEKGMQSLPDLEENNAQF